MSKTHNPQQSDSYSHPKSGTSAQAGQGPTICGFSLCFSEIQQRQRLFVEVATASSDQHAGNLCPQHLSSDRLYLFVTSFPTDSPDTHHQFCGLQWLQNTPEHLRCCPGGQGEEPKPHAPACRPGLKRWASQGVRCLFQPEQIPAGFALLGTSDWRSPGPGAETP